MNTSKLPADAQGCLDAVDTFCANREAMPDVAPDLGDPFPAPHLFIHNFDEKEMPEFQVPSDQPYAFDALAPPLEFLHPSLKGSDQDFHVAPLVDAHHWCPPDLNAHHGEAMSGLWGLKLRVITRPLPDIGSRARELKAELNIATMKSEQQDHLFEEMTGAARVSEELRPILPIKSTVKFPAVPE